MKWKEMSNLPAGAENDPRAPWNEPEVEYKTLDLEVSLTVTKSISIEVVRGSDNIEIAENIRTEVEKGLSEIGWKIEDVDW